MLPKVLIGKPYPILEVQAKNMDSESCSLKIVIEHKIPLRGNETTS